MSVASTGKRSGDTPSFRGRRIEGLSGRGSSGRARVGGAVVGLGRGSGGIYLGREKRRRQRVRAWAIAIVLALAGGGAAFAFTRPVTASVSASPPDAMVTLAADSAEGSLTAGDLKPGVYPVTVERRGFAPFAEDLAVKRFRANRLEVSLDPLPQPLSVRCMEPKGSHVSVLRGDEASKATGSWKGALPSGPVRITVSRTGYNSFTRDMFLDATSSIVVRLDPEGQLVHVLGMIECAGAPKGVALTPDGVQAWTTILNGPPSIEIFEPVSGKRLGEIDLGKYGAVEIVFTADGKRAYASQMETAKVFEIDVATHKVLRALDTKSAWSKVVELSPDDKTLYVANWSGDDVSEIDLVTGKLRRRIPVADTPRGLWAADDGRTLWVASFGTGELERVDLPTGEVKRVFRSDGGALRHLVADEKTGRLFASDMAKDCVWVTDMKTGKTKRFTSVDHKPNTIDLSPDGRVLFVSCRGENNPKSYYVPGPEWGSVLLFDARTGKALDAVVGGNQCTALDVSADGRLLAFSDFLDDRLRIYEVPAYETLAGGGGGRWKQHFADVRKD
ncbi:MAG: hypothetical protein C0418_02185 [Coriobacteriaceae bacterium]|nr:hypothetical protein [Coriobacteriaceae bacterium]